MEASNPEGIGKLHGKWIQIVNVHFTPPAQKSPFDTLYLFGDIRTMQVILASSSPYRQALFKQVRLPFVVVKPDVDEESVHALPLAPEEMTRRLAQAKGQWVLARRPEALIVAADQVGCLQGRILTKPGNEKGALAQLRQLSGQAHELITALWVHHPHYGDKIHIDRTEIWLHDLSEDVIKSYVAQEKPYDCAGSYKFESMGLALIRQLKCEDPSAIVGLPMLALGRLFAEWKLPPFFAWPEGTAL